MLRLPITFDWNEWFVLATVILTVAGAVSFRKMMPFSVAAACFLFGGSVGKWTDYVTGMHYNLYDAMDTKGHDLFDALCLSITYPLLGYFFIYFLIRLNVKGLNVTWYILFWSVTITFFEWVSSLFNVFRYIRWNLALSFLVYLVFFVALFAFYRFLQRKAAPE